jgi:hypothetical protein
MECMINQKILHVYPVIINVPNVKEVKVIVSNVKEPIEMGFNNCAHVRINSLTQINLIAPHATINVVPVTL